MVKKIDYISDSLIPIELSISQLATMYSKQSDEVYLNYATIKIIIIYEYNF